MGFFDIFRDLRDRFIPKRWGVVDEGMVFRSGRLHAAQNEKMLRLHGIKTVVNLCGDPDYHKSIPEREAAERLGIEIGYYPLGGKGQGDPEIYVEAIAKIIESKKAGKPVHVHCAAGTHRTGGVIAAYRILAQGWTARQAMEEMSRYGWDPARHKTLKPFLDENLPWIAARLAERGAIDRIPDPIPTFSSQD